MPMPKKENEDKGEFMSRCMSDSTMNKEYPDGKQRLAVCLSKATEDLGLVESVGLQIEYRSESDEDYGYPPNCKEGYVGKDGKCVDASQAAEYQGRKVTLDKPFRTPDGPKKTSVYVKNEKGNVVKVNFGDPDMEIKRDSPARKKSFRARHNCDNPGPKWKARYWSCKAWE